jgi:hypothetical protein
MRSLHDTPESAIDIDAETPGPVAQPARDIYAQQIEEEELGQF